MSATTETPAERYAWTLSQETVDLLAAILRKAELVFREVDAYCLAAERAACLLTDLRMECCQRGGAADPFPDMPMFPSFDESLARTVNSEERAR